MLSFEFQIWLLKRAQEAETDLKLNVGYLWDFFHIPKH